MAKDKKMEAVIFDINESIKKVKSVDCIISINRSKPKKGCETKILIMKNSYKGL